MCYNWESTHTKALLLIPHSFQNNALKGCHDYPTSGHLGKRTTLARLKRSFPWYDMANDVKQYVYTCGTSNKHKKPRVKPKAGLSCYHTGIRMGQFHIDNLGPFPVSDWVNKYVFLMVDQFCKWIEINALPNISAEQTAKCAVDQFFSEFGSPLQTHRPQGKNFDGSVMEALNALYHETKTNTTVYHICSNVHVQHDNHLLFHLIHCYLCDKDKTWDLHLQLLASAICSMEHRSTGYSANMMMLGVEVF